MATYPALVLSHIGTRCHPMISGRSPEPKRTAVVCTAQNYDRTKEVKRFDDSKLGVKGHVDFGITTIPRFFVHPPETLSDLKPSSQAVPKTELVPAIDLVGVESGLRRLVIINRIRRAASTSGFFQIINHGVPLDVLDRTMASIRSFHEQPMETKARFYRRDVGTGVSYLSNVDLYHSKAASWRDTIQTRLGPKMADEEKVTEICRSEVMEWDREIKRLGELLAGLLCEGLGVDSGRLKNMSCLEGRNFSTSLSNITAFEKSIFAANEKFIFMQKLSNFVSVTCDFLQVFSET